MQTHRSVQGAVKLLAVSTLSLCFACDRPAETKNRGSSSVPSASSVDPEDAERPGAAIRDRPTNREEGEADRAPLEQMRIEVNRPSVHPCDILRKEVISKTFAVAKSEITRRSSSRCALSWSSEDERSGVAAALAPLLILESEEAAKRTLKQDTETHGQDASVQTDGWDEALRIDGNALVLRKCNWVLTLELGKHQTVEGPSLKGRGMSVDQYIDSIELDRELYKKNRREETQMLEELARALSPEIGVEHDEYLCPE